MVSHLSSDSGTNRYQSVPDAGHLGPGTGTQIPPSALKGQGVVVPVARSGRFPDGSVNGTGTALVPGTTCRRCGGPGPFYESPHLKKRGVCRPCHRTATRDTDATNRGSARARWRRHWRKVYVPTPVVKLPDERLHLRKLLNRARQRCKLTGREITITLADLVMPSHCPALGIPLVWGGKRTANSPTLDRIDNARGYVPGNVAVISFRANTLKSDASLAEIEGLRAYMTSVYSQGKYETQGSPKSASGTPKLGVVSGRR